MSMKVFLVKILPRKREREKRKACSTKGFSGCPPPPGGTGALFALVPVLLPDPLRNFDLADLLTHLALGANGPIANGRKLFDLVQVGDDNQRFFGQIVQEMQIGACDWQAASNGSSPCQQAG